MTFDPSQAPRALVVDDEEVVRMLTSSALEGAGFEVEEAESGEEAIRRVGEHPPDLVLLDVEMPGCGGFEACARIRALPGCGELAILMVTSRTDEATIDRTFEVGATDFVAKPVDWQLLQHRARFLLRATRAFVDLQETMNDLLESRVRLVHAQQIARLGHWEWSPETDEMIWSEELFRVLGIEEDPEPGIAAFLDRVHPDDRPELQKMWRALADGDRTSWQLEHRLVGSDGTRIVQHDAEVTTGGAMARVVGTVQDITERRKREQQIQRLSHYDAVTGLPNRRMLYEHLDDVLASDAVQSCILLSVNIDRFRRVNDLLGSHVGDEVLRHVAATVVAGFEQGAEPGERRSRSGSFVARSGADEFVVVVREQVAVEAIAQRSSRLLGKLAQPFTVDGDSLELTASVGIARYPEDGQHSDELLRNADVARQQARARGGNDVQFSSSALNDESQRRLAFEMHLRSAIDNDELYLMYQPKIDASDGHMCGVEALIRWDSPELGSVSPGEFIPIAEECDLIYRLGEWILEHAVRELARWHAAGAREMRMAVNVSSKQLHRSEVPDIVARLLAETGIPPSSLEIEITESALLVTGAEVDRNLRALKELGVELALDDFGTGYSSLTHLFEFPIDVVKVDRSFVSDIDEKPSSAAIVRSVIQMAHELGMAVVAEGVETEGEAAELRRMSCDVLQGFFFDRPLPADEILSRLRQR